MKYVKLALLPIALAVCATTAIAQSSATIAGRVDLGLQHVPSDLTKSTDSMTAVNESSNGRLNISGREEMGNGSTAFFMLEMRFNADTGVQSDSAVLFKDKAWVGLTGPSWGEVKVGRLHSPQYGTGVAGRYEAFFGDSYASMGTRGAMSANQWNNSIYYTSPNFAGFNAGVIWQAGEKLVSNGQGGHVVYANGPLSVAVSYQKEQDKLVTTAIDTMETKTVAAYYDFGVVRIMGTYARTTGANIANTGKESVLTLGARIPMGPGEFRTSFRKIDDTARKSVSDASSDADSNRYAIGYAYPLSKRTSVNLSLVRENQKRYNANGTSKTDFSGTGYEAALRHMF
jgi:predicted porin